MPAIELNLNGDNAWPDLLPIDMKDKLIHLPDAVWQIAVLEGGMTSGKVSLALRLDLPDGSVILSETSLSAWIAAISTLRAKFPEAFANTPLAVEAKSSPKEDVLNPPIEFMSPPTEKLVEERCGFKWVSLSSGGTLIRHICQHPVPCGTNTRHYCHCGEER